MKYIEEKCSHINFHNHQHTNVHHEARVISQSIATRNLCGFQNLVISRVKSIITYFTRLLSDRSCRFKDLIACPELDARRVSV